MIWGDDGKAEAIPMSGSSFEALALPAANAKGMGVIAMKVFGQEHLVGRTSIEELIYYALSLPVRLASLGMPKPEMLEENVALGRRFQALPESEMGRLRTVVDEPQRAAFARFLRHHADA